jgi:hypothetical protein
MIDLEYYSATNIDIALSSQKYEGNNLRQNQSGRDSKMQFYELSKHVKNQ